MNVKKIVLTRNKVILLLLIAIMGSIFIMYKISETNDLKVQKIYDNEVFSKFNQEKKECEFYLKQLNLKTDKLNYLQKIKVSHSERELLSLMKTAKLNSEDNIKNDESIKSQVINDKKNNSNEATASDSKLKNQKKTAPLSSSIPPLSQEQESSGQISTVSQATPARTGQTSTQRTDGLNFNGKHYDIKSFTGLGHVPVDGYIYQWLDYKDHMHLLAERQSPVGKDVRELSVGSTIIINNQTYIIYDVITGITNDKNAYESLSKGQPALTIQSCDSAEEDSTLTFWYAS